MKMRPKAGYPLVLLLGVLLGAGGKTAIDGNAAAVLPAPRGPTMERASAALPPSPGGVVAPPTSGDTTDLSAYDVKPPVTSRAIEEAIPQVRPAPIEDDHGGATAMCEDGTLSFAASHRGACSHHGGVMAWYR